MANGLTVGMSRREEYGEATRQAIVEAARRLFSERGYFATKVDDIAALARVSVKNVSAGILRAPFLLVTWMVASTPPSSASKAATTVLEGTLADMLEQ
jgi:hypothetical protein